MFLSQIRSLILTRSRRSRPAPPEKECGQEKGSFSYRKGNSLCFCWKAPLFCILYCTTLLRFFPLRLPGLSGRPWNFCLPPHFHHNFTFSFPLPVLYYLCIQKRTEGNGFWIDSANLLLLWSFPLFFRICRIFRASWFHGRHGTHSQLRRPGRAFSLFPSDTNKR